MATSWFTDPEVMPTAHSASYVCNNLSKHGDAMVYTSVDDVIYVETSNAPYLTHKLPCAEKSTVHQVRFCSLDDLTVIVVASDNGIQIYDETGEEILAEISLKEALGDGDEGDTLYCQGICAVASKWPVLVVGTSTGKLLVVGRERESKASSGTSPSFEVQETLGERAAGICCVESSQDGTLLASSDMSGAISVRSPEDGFDVLHRLPGDEFAATCMCFLADNWLVAGYMTGCLRMFSPKKFHLRAEIAAHTRAVTALDSRDDHIASVGEDTFLNVWEIVPGKAGAGQRLRLASCQPVPNDLLTGVAFSAATSLFTASYDAGHLKLWTPE